MTSIIEKIKSFNYQSRNAKILFSFLVPLIVVFVCTPGLFFELPNKGEDKYKVSATHAFIVAVVLALFSYFYLLKKSIVV